MTKLPSESWNVVGLEGPDYPTYKVGPLCSVPGCSRLADHAHHIWRRSFLGGPFAWVLVNGVKHGNLTGLCWMHHQEVTENISTIRLEHGVFMWTDVDIVAPLHPQPPRHGKSPLVDPDDDFLPRTFEGPASVERCPSCDRPLPHKHDGKREQARRRVSWSVHVPKDKAEDGADVLDTLLEECAKIFGHDENGKTRYFTLAQALALVVQNASQMTR